MAKKTSKAGGAAAKIVEALAAIPAPLATEEQASAFGDAVAMIQDSPQSVRKGLVDQATAQIIRVVDATIASRKGGTFADDLLFGLKMIAYMGTREGVEAVIRAARKPFKPDEYMWSIVLGVFGDGHPSAARVFEALVKPLPEKFMRVCLLDAANGACREHGLKKHPFDSKEGGEALTAYLSSRKESEASYAVSACAALPFLSPARRKPLLALARKHKDSGIRMEVAWASAKLGEKEGLEYLVAACMDPNQSRQAYHYLKELKKEKLIPKAAKEPDFVALGEMSARLAHPNEFGEAPSRITQIDRRVIYWPPTRDDRVVWLFKYEYDKNRHREKKEVGIGMFGSVTFALFGETTAKMTPEELYGMHCEWELEMSEDKRAPKKRTGKAGWKLIAKGA